MRQIQTVCIFDNSSSFPDNDGGGSDVPAVHPDVIVGVGTACRHLTHVNRCCAQCTHSETRKQQHVNTNAKKTKKFKMQKELWSLPGSFKEVSRSVHVCQQVREHAKVM